MSKKKSGIKRGSVNKNKQEVLGGCGESDNHPFAWLYDMLCRKCKFMYKANGCDVWQKKCPNCQGGIA